MPFPFLSAEWMDAAKAIREKYADQSAAITITVRMNQVITDTPFDDGDIRLYLDTSSGTLVMEPGELETPDLTLTTDVTPEQIFVLAEKAKLQVVIDSLLDNAVKFTPAGGTIALGLSADGADAVITVVDTGVGIPLAEQHAVFERFHRARNVASFPGSGLGLAIVRATVVRLGGAVSFESSEAGTRFEVRLPQA